MAKVVMGTPDMAKAYIGSSEVKKMYLGNDLVYANETPIPTTRIGCWEKGDGLQGDTTWRTKTLYGLAGGASHNGRTARLVLVYRSHTSGTTYRGDIQLDRIRYGGTTFDFDSGEDWRKETTKTNNHLIGTFSSKLTSNAAVGTSVSNGYWSRDPNATGSSQTGGATAVYGGYCLYPETSGSALGDYWWAMGPTFTYSDSTIEDIIIAMEGVSCGILAVYIIDNDTTDFTPSLSNPDPYIGTKTWVYIEEVSSDPGNSDAEVQGDASGYASAGTELEAAEPASGFSIGATGEYYSTTTSTYFKFECQAV